jgi:hypothetical protein
MRWKPPHGRSARPGTRAAGRRSRLPHEDVLGGSRLCADVPRGPRPGTSSSHERPPARRGTRSAAGLHAGPALQAAAPP